MMIESCVAYTFNAKEIYLTAETQQFVDTFFNTSPIFRSEK